MEFKNDIGFIVIEKIRMSNLGATDWNGYWSIVDSILRVLDQDMAGKGVRHIGASDFCKRMGKLCVIYTYAA